MKINNVLNTLQLLTSEEWECDIPTNELRRFNKLLFDVYYDIKHSLTGSLHPPTEEELRTAAKSKIKAIKDYRKRTNCSLQEAMLIIQEHLR